MLIFRNIQLHNNENNLKFKNLLTKVSNIVTILEITEYLNKNV